MRLTRFHQIAGHADDLDASQTYYCDVLGARLLARFDPPGLLFFDFNGVRLLLERNTAPCTLYFRVDDIHTARTELAQRGVNFDGEPHMIHRDDNGVFDDAGTEEWMVFFRDPGGNVLALASRTRAGGEINAA
jgi:methylmalonyl-CoA/ethylmalonyl-CoA epimerase